jgi:hypothetical protein
MQHGMLEEILRVLKPGGMFLFLEHVAAKNQGYPSPENQKTFDWDIARYRYWLVYVTKAFFGLFALAR